MELSPTLHFPARRGSSRREFLRQIACVGALAPMPRFLSRVALDPSPIHFNAVSRALTFGEMVELYRDAQPRPALAEKLTRLLTTPVVSNQAWEGGMRPRKPVSDIIGNYLRVVQWNINRGYAFDAIRLALSDPEDFVAYIQRRRDGMGAEQTDLLRSQLDILKDADLIVLNEVDWGINRTKFRNVAAELAKSVGMNYAFAPEFIEIDPLTMGLDPRQIDPEVVRASMRPGDTRQAAMQRARKAMVPNPSRYVGLHGTAILSRYALRHVRVIRYETQGHDWYAQEKNEVVAQKVESFVGKVIFDEPLTRQVRRGGRMMLLADVEDADLPMGRATIVATHLEDLTIPANRQRQLSELLHMIGEIPNPVIVAGDMNTTTHAGMPIGFVQAMEQTVRSPRAWAARGGAEVVEKVVPLGWAWNIAKDAAKFIHQEHDPTSTDIPFLMDNPEEKFFRMMEQFRFADGTCFDFRGDTDRSSNGRRGILANSNERAEKGFIPTQDLARTYGPVGQYKIDWIFVRPGNLTDPHDAEQSYRFSPHFGRTLRHLNHGVPGGMSDHNPIAADLPLSNLFHGDKV